MNFLHGKEIQEGLGGVLMDSISSIDEAKGRIFLKLFKFPVESRSYNAKIDSLGVKGVESFLKPLPLFEARCFGLEVDVGGPEVIDGNGKGMLCSRGVFEKTRGDERAFDKGDGQTLPVVGKSFEFLREVKETVNLSFIEIFYGGED